MADVVTGGVLDQAGLGPMAAMGSNAVTLVIIVICGLILVAILVALLLGYMHSRRYKQYKVIIFQSDGVGHTIWRTDDGGIFVDGKTGNKRLFLKNSKVGLEPDNIPFIPTSKGNKVVMVLQTGLKNFKYIWPVIKADLIQFTVGEEDVNWAVNEYEAQKKRFNMNWIAQYLPFIILAFCFIVMSILMVSIFQKLPMIKDIVLEMKNVAELLVQARSGTTIIPTG